MSKTAPLCGAVAFTIRTAATAATGGLSSSIEVVAAFSRGLTTRWD